MTRYDSKLFFIYNNLYYINFMYYIIYIIIPFVWKGIFSPFSHCLAPTLSLLSMVQWDTRVATRSFKQGHAPVVRRIDYNQNKMGEKSQHSRGWDQFPQLSSDLHTHTGPGEKWWKVCWAEQWCNFVLIGISLRPKGVSSLLCCFPSIYPLGWASFQTTKPFFLTFLSDARIYTPWAV